MPPAPEQSTATDVVADGSPSDQPVDDQRRVELAVSGMTCAACAARVERKLNKLDDVEASVNYATGRAEVAATGTDDAALKETVRKAGYEAEVVEPFVVAPDSGEASPDEPAEPADDQRSDAGSAPSAAGPSASEQHSRDLWRRLVVSVALFIPLADLSILFTALPAARFPGWQWLLVVLALPVAGWAAWPFHRRAATGARHGAASMDTLVSVGILAASLWSLYAIFFQDQGAVFQDQQAVDASGIWLLLRSEGAIYLEVAAGVTTFVLAGRYFEARAQRRAGDALRVLAELRAKTVTLVLDDGSQQEVPLEQLRVGQRFAVRPGATVVTDGRVVEGRAAVDRSSMTGESVPVESAVGDEVTGGTVVRTGRLIVEATRVGADTRLAEMVRLVERAQSGKAAVQRLADRIAGVFVPVVLVLAALTLAGWLLLDGSVEDAVTAALAVLVIACPCALGLATPTALMVASGRGAQLGIFIKGYQALESTRSVDTVVLDKTGTVTGGRMSVVDVQTAPDVDRATVLRLAGALEDASEHAVAAAISDQAKSEVDGLPRVAEFANVPGLGAGGTVDDREVLAGRAELFRERGWEVPEDVDERRRRAEDRGRTAVLAGWDGSARAVIALRDEVKPSAAGAVRQLHELGLRTVLLTGDNATTARVVGDEVGVGEVVAEVLPDQKVEAVRELRSQGRSVAVVGDGVNDAPALVTADLGLAVGTGTDVAIDAADMILVREELTVVPDALQLARATLRTIRGNLAWAFGYNLAAIPLAAFGLLNPLIAAATMALSSFFVVSNSLRLKKFK